MTDKKCRLLEGKIPTVKPHFMTAISTARKHLPWLFVYTILDWEKKKTHVFCFGWAFEVSVCPNLLGDCTPLFRSHWLLLHFCQLPHCLRIVSQVLFVANQYYWHIWAKMSHLLKNKFAICWNTIARHQRKQSIRIFKRLGISRLCGQSLLFQRLSVFRQHLQNFFLDKILYIAKINQVKCRLLNTKKDKVLPSKP